MNKGYTLIELLISLTLLMLVTGAGIATFMTFTTKQQMVEASKNVQNMMRSAQVKASAGDLPAGCTSLKSYRVNLVADSSTVTLSGVCSVPNQVFQVSSYVMPGQVVATATLQEDFLVLRAGVDPGGNISVQTATGTLPSYRYQFTLDKGGSITEGAFY